LTFFILGVNVFYIYGEGSHPKNEQLLRLYRSNKRSLA